MHAPENLCGMKAEGIQQNLRWLVGRYARDGWTKSSLTLCSPTGWAQIVMVNAPSRQTQHPAVTSQESGPPLSICRRGCSSFLRTTLQAASESRIFSIQKYYCIIYVVSAS
jgi:hypothetical protein